MDGCDGNPGSVPGWRNVPSRLDDEFGCSYGYGRPTWKSCDPGRGYGYGTGYGHGTACGNGSTRFETGYITNCGMGRGVSDDGVGHGDACGSGTIHSKGQGKGFRWTGLYGQT